MLYASDDDDRVVSGRVVYGAAQEVCDRLQEYFDAEHVAFDLDRPELISGEQPVSHVMESNAYADQDAVARSMAHLCWDFGIVYL